MKIECSDPRVTIIGDTAVYQFVTSAPNATWPQATIIAPEIDPLVLDSVFEKPGRNDPCHCDSGKKYKKCCEDSDEMARRFVRQKTVEAHVACAYLRTVPESTCPEYNPPPEEVFDDEEEDFYD